MLSVIGESDGVSFKRGRQNDNKRKATATGAY